MPSDRDAAERSARSRRFLMDHRSLLVILTAGAGGLIALQAPINAGLARATGCSSPAALVSFTIGAIALAAIVVLSGEAGGLSSTFSVSWYYLLGGLLGAVYVANALIAVSVIPWSSQGAILRHRGYARQRQLTASVVIDQGQVRSIHRFSLEPGPAGGLAATGGGFSPNPDCSARSVDLLPIGRDRPDREVRGANSGGANSQVVVKAPLDQALGRRAGRSGG